MAIQAIERKRQRWAVQFTTIGDGSVRVASSGCHLLCSTWGSYCRYLWDEPQVMLGGAYAGVLVHNSGHYFWGHWVVCSCVNLSQDPKDTTVKLLLLVILPGILNVSKLDLCWIS
jgi:hypothetical protein